MPKDITDETVNSAEIARAKAVVKSNAERFESAMEQLADRVEATSDTLRAPIRKARQIKAKALDLTDTAISNPYVQQALSFSGFLFKRIRRNPRPYTLAALGVFGAIALISYSRRIRERTSLEHPA